MFSKCAKFAATQGALLGWLFTQSLCIWWGFVFNIEGGFPSTRPRWAGSTGKDKYHTLALVALRSFSSSVTVHSVHLPKATLIGRTRCLRDRLTDRFLMTPLLFTSSNWFSSLYQGKPSDFVILNGQTPQPFWPSFLPRVLCQELDGCVDGWFEFVLEHNLSANCVTDWTIPTLLQERVGQERQEVGKL